MNVVNIHYCCSECDEAMQWCLLCRLLTWPHGLFSNYTIYWLRTIIVPLYILIIQVPAGFTWMPKCPSSYWILLHFRFTNSFWTILIVLIKCSTISRSARGFMHLRVSRVDAGENTSYRLGEFDKTFSSIVGMVHHYTINRWVSGSASSFLIRTFHSNDVNIVRCLTSFLWCDI